MNMKTCNLSEDLAQDRSYWTNKIYVADPTQLRQGFNDDDGLEMEFVEAKARIRPSRHVWEERSHVTIMCDGWMDGSNHI